MKQCQRTGCTNEVESKRSKYCSDACRDTHQRAQITKRIPKGIARRTYRVYDYRNPEPPP